MSQGPQNQNFIGYDNSADALAKRLDGAWPGNKGSQWNGYELGWHEVHAIARDAINALRLKELENECAKCGCALQDRTSAPRCVDCVLDDSHRQAWADERARLLAALKDSTHD